jgi:DNA-binding response OmpR family regulator
MSPALSASPATSRASSRAPNRLRVVVIDDEPDAVLMLLTLLRDEGYEAEGFASGKAALNSLRAYDPDVVISDVAMPTVNGWDIAREVRRIMGESRPTLIGVSGHYVRTADKILAELAGFNYYLTKPFDPKALMALLAPLASGK